jgi:hypothetical protein
LGGISCKMGPETVGVTLSSIFFIR